MPQVTHGYFQATYMGLWVWQEPKGSYIHMTCYVHKLSCIDSNILYIHTCELQWCNYNKYHKGNCELEVHSCLCFVALSSTLHRCADCCFWVANIACTEASCILLQHGVHWETCFKGGIGGSGKDGSHSSHGDDGKLWWHSSHPGHHPSSLAWEYLGAWAICGWGVNKGVIGEQVTWTCLQSHHSSFLYGQWACLGGVEGPGSAHSCNCKVGSWPLSWEREDMERWYGRRV